MNEIYKRLQYVVAWCKP